MPATNRIKKINGSLQRELGRIILKEIDLSNHILVTLTKVETSKDLSQCKVFVSVFPGKDTKNVLKILRGASYNLHQRLNKILFIRKVPKLEFFEEKQLPKVQRIDEILDSLRQDN